ncbi:MAG: PhzF family phenazine biosynthesis protein [Gammaproteobacteria bacterium]
MQNILIVDCFCTNKPNAGNPAAVVTEFQGGDREKLALAKKLNQPVTVFIANQNSHEPTIQFFYPEAKMPLCIHGTLAAAKIILPKDQLAINFKTDDGKTLAVRKQKKNIYEVKVERHDFAKPIIKNEDILRMLNLQDTDSINNTLPLCIESAGSSKLLIPLTTLTLLQDLQPNFELIKQWSIQNKINGLYVYTDQTSSETADFHARGFNPKTGHNEDAATGVAAAALSLALQKNISIEQGHSINMPCLIAVSYINQKTVYVGGAVSDSKQTGFQYTMPTS